MGTKLVGKPFTKSSCHWCSIALEVGYWIDISWGQQYSLFSSMTGKTKERACLLNSDLLPSFQNAGRQGESSKWSWQVGAVVWTDGKREQFRKKNVKMPCLDIKKSHGSVQDRISWQDCRHAEEDLGITHDVRLLESTVSDCCRKKPRYFTGMCRQNCCKACKIRQGWKKGRTLARRLKGEALAVFRHVKLHRGR